MLTITVPGVESFDDAKQEFVTTEETTLDLEHSLVSLSKWEQLFRKPFLGNDKKTNDEVIGYIKCMTLTPDVPSEVFTRLSDDNLKAINAYIDEAMTATWFSPEPNKPGGSRESITNELIYYWMSALNIDLEWENRHLNRLFTFIRVVNSKNAPAKKMSRRDIVAQQRELNERRKAQMKTSG